MRWITFLILLYLMHALQLAHLGGIPHGSGAHWPRIEFLALLAIFYGLFAAEVAAPMCGLLCGLCYDLANQEMIGTHAVPLALTTVLIVRIRLSIFREHFVSQVFVTFLGVMVFGLLDVVVGLIIGAKFDGHSAWVHFGHFAGNALYTALVGPFLYGLFFRFQPVLGFSSHGPRTRIHEGRR